MGSSGWRGYGCQRTRSLFPCATLFRSARWIWNLDFEESCLLLEAAVKVNGRTGVEMEALTAVSIAALTVYDMCKAVDKNGNPAYLPVGKRRRQKRPFYRER